MNVQESVKADIFLSKDSIASRTVSKGASASVSISLRPLDRQSHRRFRAGQEEKARM